MLIFEKIITPLAQQSLLRHILATALEEPKTLATDLLRAVTAFSKLFSSKEDEDDRLADKSQLMFLTLENIIFNVYSKLKNTENVKPQDSPLSAQSSQSYSAINLDSPVVLHHKKFNKFLKRLLDNQNFYEVLLKIIPKTIEGESLQLVALQVLA